MYNRTEEEKYCLCFELKIQNITMKASKKFPNQDYNFLKDLIEKKNYTDLSDYIKNRFLKSLTLEEMHSIRSFGFKFQETDTFSIEHAEIKTIEFV